MYLDTDNVPFYIGKGKDYRYATYYHLDESNPNRLLKNKIHKVGVANVKIHFLHKDISEEESFSWERYWIKYIGRRDKGEGTLCNLTDGGEGQSGFIHSEETRQKISKGNKGKPAWNKNKTSWSKGKKLSENHKRKIGEANKGKLSGREGKYHSEESKQKMRKPKSDKTRYNMSVAQKKRREQEKLNKVKEL